MESYIKTAKFIKIGADLNEVRKAKTYQDLQYLIGGRYSFEDKFETIPYLTHKRHANFIVVLPEKRRKIFSLQDRR